MATDLQFDLVSPERLLQSATVHMVTVPGEEGDFSVMANHAPVLSTVRPGVIDIYDGAGAAPEKIFIRGGFAEVTPAGLTILAEEARPVAEVDIAVLEQQMRDLGEDVADAKDDDSRRRAQSKLDNLRQVIDVLKA